MSSEVESLQALATSRIVLEAVRREPEQSSALLELAAAIQHDRATLLGRLRSNAHARRAWLYPV